MPYFLKEVENGPLKIWKEPEAGTQYTVGVDTSTGVGQDYTVMQVLSNRLPFEQVAMFRAKYSVVDCARIADELGRYYNTALMVVETNYPGNAVCDGLVQQYQYPRNYQAEEHLDEAPRISCKFGYQTTQASKWLLIREMQHALMQGDIILNDATTIEELGTYVYIEDRTKTGAAQGLNDDCVMAIMLAYHGALLYPQKAKPRPQKPTEVSAQQKKMMDQFMAGIINNKKQLQVL